MLFFVKKMSQNIDLKVRHDIVTNFIRQNTKLNLLTFNDKINPEVLYYGI